MAVGIGGVYKYVVGRCCIGKIGVKRLEDCDHSTDPTLCFPSIAPYHRSFPSILSSSHHPTKSHPNRKTFLTITIHPLASPPTFPAHHRIDLSCPALGPFAHWVYNLTPFSFRTLVTRERWDCSEKVGGKGENGRDGEDERERLFGRFGSFVRDLVQGCCAEPGRWVFVHGSF